MLIALAATLTWLRTSLINTAEETCGPFGPILAPDQPYSSAPARESLGWALTHSTLLEDLKNIQP